MTVMLLVTGMLLGVSLIFTLLAVAVWYLMQDT
jgi:hypothetical protein